MNKIGRWCRVCGELMRLIGWASNGLPVRQCPKCKRKGTKP